MRELLFILIALLSVSAQASSYFIDASGECAGMISTQKHEIKISVHYDTVSMDSTMVCSNVCKWQYTYHVDSSSMAYKISYLTDFIAIVKISFSFFDSLNRAFMFTVNGFNPQATVDSIWGDTISLPGYNKALYARIRVPSFPYEILYLTSFSIVGTLKQNANINFVKTIGPLSFICGCPDSTLFPHGKWNWIYTEGSSCYPVCIYSYSYPTSIGHNYYYVFSNDSVCACKDSAISFIDTISSLNLCNHSFNTYHSLYFPDTLSKNVTCKYSFIGEKILCLTQTTGYLIPYTNKYYFLSSGTSVDSFLATATNCLRFSSSAGKFSVRQLANSNIRVSFNLVKSSNVNLVLYSMSGKAVSILFDSYQMSGKYEYTFKLPLLSKGCYIFVLKKNDQIETVKFNNMRSKP